MSTSSNIWVYEKGSNRVFRTSVKTVANENNRWPKNTEKYLANHIEAPANLVLDKIRERQPITQGDKDVFSAYMVTMLQRVPKGLQRTKAAAPEVMDKVFTDLKRDIMTLITAHPARESVLQNILQKLPSLRSKYEIDFPMEAWYQNITPDALPRVRVVLPAMTWIFLTSDKGQPFLTNDNPVFFFEGIGIGKPESEITFPISNTVVLWATWRKNLVEGYVPAKETVIREINRRTASAATRYVYYSKEEQWVVGLIQKKNPKLHKLA
ncbi:MAG: hypothetical protein A2Z28_04500 [Chloroflexi bacterium RBG_16_51_9]|nr:MAG: hypothetical protein A2Z28_04500 [Chloroflexi bacterium RBG_16_51_9]